MSKILVISGHPQLETSNANALILKRLEESGLDLTVHRLDALYPEGTPVNIDHEHDAMRSANTIIFQYPLYWYNVPAILKKWMDSVFTFGFAFGPDGSELAGKTFLSSVTIGSREQKYPAAETLEENMAIECFLKPVHALAEFSEMQVDEAICSFSMAYISGVHPDNKDVLMRAETHAERLIAALQD